MLTPTVYVDVDDRDDQGKIARITVGYPARVNILTTPLIQKLKTAIQSFHNDERLINEMVGLDPASAETFITRLHGVCAAIRNLPVPVIARISGYCLGGGLEVAAACDLRVATEDSTFGMPELNVGIPCVIEAALLPRLVGWGKAREIIYTGRALSATEALGCGLVERVTAPEKLDRAVDEWVEAIINAGAQAIRLQKALIRQWEILPIHQGIEKGIQAFGQAYQTDEPRTFMERFLKTKRDGK